MKEFELFKRICGEYDGKFVEEENRITFTANNKISSHFQNGSVHTEKVVECCLRVQAYEIEGKGKWVCFSGEEKTYSILGGFGGAELTEENLRRKLKFYNFKPKDEKQMSFFDLG